MEARQHLVESEIKANNSESENDILNERLFEKIYFWHQVYRSVYYLWLDSSEYETWATQQLENPYSYANQKGLKLLPELNAHGKFFFLLFSRVHDEDWVVPTHCPLCQRSLERLPNLGTTTDLACGNCHIVMQSD